MKSSVAPTYVRVLNLLHALRQMSPINRLSADEVALLDRLIVTWHEQTTVTIGELMASGSFGAPTTAYRRVISLRDKGLVELRVDGADRRVKYVEPTDVARGYIDDVKAIIGRVDVPPKPA